MFFNGESIYSFVLTVFLLFCTTILSSLYLSHNQGNRKRYKFIKAVRIVSLYMLVPAYILLALGQIFKLFNSDFINFQHSLWQLVYLGGAAISLYFLWYKIIAQSNEAIYHFRRGSFDSGKFQKTYDSCRRYTSNLVFIALLVLALQYFILDL